MGLKYDFIQDEGNLSVACDPALYGGEQVTLRYRLWFDGKEPRDLSGELALTGKRYRQAYDRLLGAILTAYQRSPGWDVWIEEKQTFEKLTFSRREELHPYLGLPDIELAWYENKALWGLTFGGRSNRLSIEHGLCAVFQEDELLALIDYTDFPNILQWWEEYRQNNILTPSGE